MFWHAGCPVRCYRRDIRAILLRCARRGPDMRKHTCVAAALLGLTLLSAAWPAAGADPKSAIDEIRKELMQLPYYSVFDFLAFSYEDGTVTLVGYAYHPTLKKDAARLVKRVAGVDTVVDKIEELPGSPNDDEIRWSSSYTVYRDPVLSRHAPGRGALLERQPTIR